MSDMDVVMGEPRRGDGVMADEENEAMEYIQPVALLMDELKSEDISVRVEAMRRIKTIALALGPERSRNELVPFLESSLDEEDEVLATLAEELGSLAEQLGSGGVLVLLRLLEGLFSAEEPLVRQKALESFEGSLLPSLSEAECREHLLPLTQRLSTGDWFSKKTSAVTLIVDIIGHVSRLKSDDESSSASTLISLLISQFTPLAVDESPLVRKAVATNLSKLVALTEDNVIKDDLVPVTLQLSNDPQDSVRLLAPEPLSLIMEKLGDSMIGDDVDLVAVFLALAGDNSWRIRFMVATHFGRFIKALMSNPKIDTITIFCALLRDLESEVRCAACSQISEVARVAGVAATEEHILGSIQLLLSDASPPVRASLALQLNDLAKVFGNEA